ncbi:hypothetical protein ALC62_02803 [Cyphomyrmex costatus]|uniref:Uncharacterized protein n=1 Tax=Cyphomyrmex costatus TaxID=456900 RepID=A0A151IMT3_9HYME|nr:hypothetical protein ALC62_02803 [Cyphomyrmex costatus]
MSHTSAFAAAKTISKRRELDKQRESDRRDSRSRPDNERDNRDARYLAGVNNSRRFVTPTAYQRMPHHHYRVNTT